MGGVTLKFIFTHQTSVRWSRRDDWGPGYRGPPPQAQLEGPLAGDLAAVALGRWPVGVSGRDGSLWAERASQGQALCLGHGQPGLRGPAPTLSLGHRAPACETSARAEGRGPTAGPPLPQQATSPLMAPLPQPVTGVHDCMRVHSHGCVRSTRVESRQTQSASGCRPSARTCAEHSVSILPGCVVLPRWLCERDRSASRLREGRPPCLRLAAVAVGPSVCAGDGRRRRSSPP